MKYIIRSPQRHELDEIIELYRTTMEHTLKKEGIYSAFSTEVKDAVQQLEWRLKQFYINTSVEDTFFIARSEEAIIGMIAYGPANAIIQKHLNVDFSLTPEIKSVYVHPLMQKKGLGRHLFQEVLEHLTLTKIEHFCLDCGFNLSQAFWLQQLGEATIRLENYWSPDNHHLIWYQKVENYAKSVF